MSSSNGRTGFSSKFTASTTAPKDGILSKIPMAASSSSTSSSSGSSSASMALPWRYQSSKARKENVIPSATTNASSSSLNSASSSSRSGTAAAAAELYASKDIDRIAKYKADRRKAIYLRNTVQENENERLEHKKRSSSRSTTNAPTSAIHSKSQTSTTILSSKAPSSSSAARTTPTTTTSSSSSRSSATQTKPQSSSFTSSLATISSKPLSQQQHSIRSNSSSSNAVGGGGATAGGGSLPLSPSHQSQQQQQRKPRNRSSTGSVTSEEKQIPQQVKQQQQQQQQPIRTTRSSRLRAAALEKERASSSAGASKTASALFSAGASSRDTLQTSLNQSLQRSKISPNRNSSGGSSKLLLPSSVSAASSSGSTSSSQSNSNTSHLSADISTESISSNVVRSKAPIVKQDHVKKQPATVAAESAAAKPRMVPTIAVNMKQKLRGLTETIKRDINRNKTSIPSISSSSSSNFGKTVLSNNNGNNHQPADVANVLNGNGDDADVATSAGDTEIKNINNNNVTETVMKQQSDSENAFFEQFPTTGRVLNGATPPERTSPSNQQRAPLSSIGSLSSLDSPTVMNSRMRTSTMKSGIRTRFSAVTAAAAAATGTTVKKTAVSPFPEDIESLSPVLDGGENVAKTAGVRDKSDKRKSNLNRSQHEEATDKRPSSTEKRRHRKSSGVTPASSSDAVKTTENRSIASPRTTSSKRLQKSSSSEKAPSSVAVSSARSPQPATATSSATSLASPSLRKGSSSRQSSSSPRVAVTASPVSSSAPSSPAKFSALARVSLTPSPVRKLPQLLRSPPRLLHSSSSSATLAAAEIATGSPGSSRDRLDVVRVDSRISASTGGSQEQDTTDTLPDSPLVQPYSKFSQMLKSPTLEKYQDVTVRPVRLVLEDELQEQQQEVPLDLDEQEVLVPLEAELVLPLSNEGDENGNSSEVEAAAASIVVIEDDEPSYGPDLEEAGPSGLGTIVIDDDEDDDAIVEIEELAACQVLEEIKRSGSTSPRRANKILFDDKFNDEFVVIENSPKSHFIQSLDETDIIVIGDNDEDYPPRPASSNSTGRGAGSYEKKLVKMSSVEHFENLHQRKSSSPLLRKKSLSPIMRAKSMEENHLSSSGSSASNHIVSILKRKTVESNSSASSNASPVTFSPSVVDTPIRSNRRQGILKKRCSLDESRYSRSHSPDDRSILVKHTRRNSFEDTGTQHGILKQKSYESKEDVSTAGINSGSTTAVNSVVSHGILKKKTDSSSTSTPNEQPKHVSISQAVILAAAEICQDMLLDHEHDHEIRPILKSDSQPLPTPKPILKKKYSSESEEIRPILKTSRKSSREENSDSEELKRSILKSQDSPSKRRSFGERSDSGDSGTSTVLMRSRSLEHPEPVPIAPIVPQVPNIEKPIISVAERIKHMEKFLAGPSSGSGAVPKRSNSTNTNGGGTATSRRESYRFKTQPVTSTEIVGVQQQVDRLLDENPDESNSSLESSYNQAQTEAPPDCLTPESGRARGSLETLTSKDKQLSEDKSVDLLSPTLATAESNSHSISGEFNLASLSSDSGIQFGRGTTEETSGTDNVSSLKTSDSEKSPSRKTIDDDLNELEEEDDDDNEEDEENEEHLQIIEETEGQQRLLLSPSIHTGRSTTDSRRRVTTRKSSSCSSTSGSSDLSDREEHRMYTAGTSQHHHHQNQREDLYTPISDLEDDPFGRPRSNSVRARANMFQQMGNRMKENECPSLQRGRKAPTTAPHFATQIISPTDMDRSHNTSGSTNIIGTFGNNSNNISDDSGAEFDPSTLQVSKKIKLFSGGRPSSVLNGVDSTAALVSVNTAISTADGGCTVLKKKSMKFRTIGKLIMPKFLNDNNNNISKTTPPSATVGGDFHELQQNDLLEKAEDAVSQQRTLKVEHIRRKFMRGSSTPILDEEQSMVNGDDGSDSNVESGKENHYDSGGEYGSKPGGCCGGIAALKRTLLNNNRSQNKSILLNSSAELEEVVAKGKVSTMAKQWNRLRAVTLDASVIKQPSIQERTCESLPSEISTNNSSVFDKSSFAMNKSKRRDSPQIDGRIAKYFGLKTHQNDQSDNGTQQESNKCRRRSRSLPRGNQPTPSPQRPIEERIAKYFGMNKSFTGGSSSPQANKPRAIVRPQQRVVVNSTTTAVETPKIPAMGSGNRRRSLSAPTDKYFEELAALQDMADSGCHHTASFCLPLKGHAAAGSLQLMKNFDDFNLTAEDISMAESEFDKLYVD